MSGWWALRCGRKRLMMACTGLFILASMLCWMALAMLLLIIARVLQGVGGGAVLHQAGDSGAVDQGGQSKR